MNTPIIFSIKDLVSRLQKMAEENRYDTVIGTIRDIYENRMKKDSSVFIYSDDIKKTYSSLSNLNTQSNFKEYFSDIFPSKKQEEPKINNSFRHAGYEEDFRPTPVDSVKPEEKKIQENSLNAIMEIASSKIVSNPQYHFHEFVRVATEGKNSGIALWSISFDTSKGKTRIQVPVIVVEGTIQKPSSFYVKGSYKPFAFNSESIKNYSSTYVPSFRAPLTENSGVKTIGIYSVMSDRQDIKEAELETMENNNLSVGYSIPVDESLTAKLDEAQKGVMEVIDKARNFAESKINRGQDGNIMNINLQISYSGYMNEINEPVEMPEEKPLGGIIAFNASQKTKSGLKTITIPVFVNGNQFSANKFHTKNGSYDLNANSVLKYFAEEEKVEDKEETIDSDSFSDAFLISSASLNEIRREMKNSVDSDNLKRAATCLKVISNRFGNDAFKSASYEFIQFVQENIDSKNNIKRCASCKFYSEPGTKGSIHNIPFCNKLSVDVNKAKLGNLAPSDCIKKESSFHWVPEDGNYISSENVFINQED